jgi:hypothetical protein
MRVALSDRVPVFDGDDYEVRFFAQVDDAEVECSITVEALEDHFGAASALEGPLLEAFARERSRIEAVCARALEHNGGQPVILRSGVVRMLLAAE